MTTEPSGVVRRWEGRVREGAADAYLTFLREEIVPEIRAMAGCTGVEVLRGVGSESDRFVVTSRWVDLDAIRAFAGLDAEGAVVPPEARALLAEYDARARHLVVAFRAPD